jgi:hypothetical protein
MHNLAKVVRGFLIGVGILSLVTLSYGFYKYKSMSDQLDHLNNYIETYIQTDEATDKVREDLIKKYELQIKSMEATIEELKKRGRDKWWGDKLA